MKAAGKQKNKTYNSNIVIIRRASLNIHRNKLIKNKYQRIADILSIIYKAAQYKNRLR